MACLVLLLLLLLVMVLPSESGMSTDVSGRTGVRLVTRWNFPVPFVIIVPLKLQLGRWGGHFLRPLAHLLVLGMAMSGRGMMKLLARMMVLTSTIMLLLLMTVQVRLLHDRDALVGHAGN